MEPKPLKFLTKLSTLPHNPGSTSLGIHINSRTIDARVTDPSPSGSMIKQFARWLQRQGSVTQLALHAESYVIYFFIYSSPFFVSKWKKEGNEMTKFQSKLHSSLFAQNLIKLSQTEW